MTNNAFGYVDDSHRMQFTGHERDEETGLDYMQARHYGSALGRFVSVDTVGGRGTDPQTLNLYAYVNNNPLCYVDPTGRSLADIGVLQTDNEYVARETERRVTAGWTRAMELGRFMSLLDRKLGELGGSPEKNSVASGKVSENPNNGSASETEEENQHTGPRPSCDIDVRGDQGAEQSPGNRLRSPYTPTNTNVSNTQLGFKSVIDPLGSEGEAYQVEISGRVTGPVSGWEFGQSYGERQTWIGQDGRQYSSSEGNGNVGARDFGNQYKFIQRPTAGDRRFFLLDAPLLRHVPAIKSGILLQNYYTFASYRGTILCGVAWSLQYEINNGRATRITFSTSWHKFN